MMSGLFDEHEYKNKPCHWGSKYKNKCTYQCGHWNYDENHELIRCIRIYTSLENNNISQSIPIIEGLNDNCDGYLMYNEPDMGKSIVETRLKNKKMERIIKGKIIDGCSFTQSNKNNLTIQFLGQHNLVTNQFKIGDEVQVIINK